MNKRRAKLDPTTVQTARDLHRAGYSMVSIGVVFGVSLCAVQGAVRGRTWKNLPDVPQPLPDLTQPPYAALKRRTGPSCCDPRVSDQQVREIRTLSAAGYSQVSIAAAYGVVAGTVSHIVHCTARTRVAEAFTALPDVTKPPFTCLKRPSRGCTTLGQTQVKEIRQLAALGYTYASIAAHYHVMTATTIGNIVRRETHRDVPDEPVTLPDLAITGLTRLASNDHLTARQVQEVRDLCRAGFTQLSIATAYGLRSQSMVSEIASGKLYAAVPDVPGPLPEIVSNLRKKPVSTAREPRTPGLARKRLDAAKVQQIRDARRAGYTGASISAAFKVGETTVSNIVLGRRWSHLPDVPEPTPDHPALRRQATTTAKHLPRHMTRQRLPRPEYVPTADTVTTDHPLTPEQVEQVRALAGQNVPHQIIAKQFGVDRGCIEFITQPQAGAA
jgi:hypothetical protein